MPAVTAKVPGDGTNTLTFTIPGLGMDVEAVYVEVDGSGAGGDITGTLEIADQSGVVIAAKPQDDTMDAATDVSATWALRLNDSARQASGAVALPFAAAIRFTQSIPNNTPTQITLTTNSATAAFATSDASIFDLDSGEFAILVPGTYLLIAWAHFLKATAPAAGSVAVVGLGSDLLEGTSEAVSPWYQAIGDTIWLARPIYSGYATFKAGTGETPTSEPLVVGQRTGGTINGVNTGVAAVQLSTSGLF